MQKITTGQLLPLIGNSAAGLAAARTVRKLQPAAQITIISDEPGPAYARCLIPDILGGNKDIHEISYVMKAFTRNTRLNYYLKRWSFPWRQGAVDLVLQTAKFLVMTAYWLQPALPL